MKDYEPIITEFPALRRALVCIWIELPREKEKKKKLKGFQFPYIIDCMPRALWLALPNHYYIYVLPLS